VKIGIVTVSYNQARYLQEAIDSVRVSPPHSLDYVIVDPGSKDGSREIIEHNRQRFSKMLLQPDKGPADGLNSGFAACSADVFGYLNSDDRFTPGALDFVADHFEAHPEIDLLLGAIRVIDADGNASWRGRAADPFHVRTFAHHTSFPWQQGTFFRSELFRRTKGFNLENKLGWDGELVLDMALAGARIGYTNTIPGDFRIYAESITGTGRLEDLNAIQYARYQQKIKSAGHEIMTPAEEKLARLIYKYNPLRHLRCAFGIQMPEVKGEPRDYSCFSSIPVKK
jgi:glycosyltransferase involved in cell wall biosynthesis